MTAKPYQDQVALVTGAGKGTGGVGRAIAHALAAGGARVMVADVDPKVAETAAEVKAESGMDTLRFEGSLADEANVRRMVEDMVKHIGEH